MRNNSSFYKPKKAVIIAKYQGPDIAHEQVLKNNVKCASIVENRDGKLARFEAQVNLNVGPIFGKVLWHQISNSAYFCVHFTTWLFYQWRRIEERKGEGNSTAGRLIVAGRLMGVLFTVLY